MFVCLFLFNLKYMYEYIHCCYLSTRTLSILHPLHAMANGFGFISKCISLSSLYILVNIQYTLARSCGIFHFIFRNIYNNLGFSNLLYAMFKRTHATHKHTHSDLQTGINFVCACFSWRSHCCVCGCVWSSLVKIVRPCGFRVFAHFL